MTRGVNLAIQWLEHSNKAGCLGSNWDHDWQSSGELKMLQLTTFSFGGEEIYMLSVNEFESDEKKKGY